MRETGGIDAGLHCAHGPCAVEAAESAGHANAVAAKMARRALDRSILRFVRAEVEVLKVMMIEQNQKQSNEWTLDQRVNE